MKKNFALEVSSVGNPLVYLVWEQAPTFVSLRGICSSKELAEIGKKIFEKEYTTIKRRLFSIEKSEIDHFYGSVEMYNLTQIERRSEEGRIKELEYQLHEVNKNYEKAVKYIRFLEEKR